MRYDAGDGGGGEGARAEEEVGIVTGIHEVVMWEMVEEERE